ncbi:LOC111597534 [Sergentomyia squamirostris]
MAEKTNQTKENNGELNTPDFLNHDFFEKVLQNDEGDKALKIYKLEIILASKPGEHIASIMFKAIIDYISRGRKVTGRRLIVKTTPVEEGLRKDLLKEHPFFDREIEMYTKVLPEMKKIMKSIGDDEEMWGKIVYCCDDPAVIILDDVTMSGYSMDNHLQNFDDTMTILKMLAKFHAISFYMNDNKYAHKLDLTKYEAVLSEDLIKNFQVFFEGFEALKEQVDKWPGYEKVSKTLIDLNTKFPERLTKVFKSNSDFSILCHGDFHVRNMMFIKNGKSIEKTVLLDYQLSFWGSQAIDIIYTFYTIADDEALARRDELLFNYHVYFCEYLTRLGCLKKPPSLLDLNKEILDNGAIDLFMGICCLPLFRMDYSKTDLTAFADPTRDGVTAVRRMAYSEAKTVKMLKRVLPELVHKGILY